ncbi:MAG: hypothetical protein IJS96_05425 [Schwartzia sp.]|nr:hypothetical protein [Schwartzia sp. (in: firmicutes)]
MTKRLLALNIVSFAYLCLAWLGSQDAAAGWGNLSMLFFFQFAVAAGGLSFGLAALARPARDDRRSVVAANLASLALLWLTPAGAVASGGLWFPVVLTVFLTTLGYLLGLGAYWTARGIEPARLGRFVGLFLALASALFAGVDALARENGAWMAGAAMFLLFLPMARLLLLPSPAAREAQPNPEVEHDLWLFVIIAALLWFLYGFNDSLCFLQFADYRGDYLYLSRGAYVAGLLLAGWLADRRRLLLPLAALAAQTAELAFHTFTREDGALSVFYFVHEFFSAFSIVFVTLLFLEVAMRTRRPELWAWMGRVVGMPASALGVALGLSLLRSQPLTVSLLVYTGLLMAVAALFYQGLLRYALQGGMIPALASPLMVGPGDVPMLFPQRMPEETTPPDRADRPPDFGLAEEARPPEDASATGETPPPPEDLFPAGDFVSALEDIAPMPEGLTPSADITLTPEDLAAATPVPSPLPEKAAPAENDTPLPAAESSEQRLAAYREHYGLTQRETEVLAIILQRRTIAEMAEDLFISPRTVKFHIGNLLAKTGTHSQAELLERLEAMPEQLGK